MKLVVRITDASLTGWDKFLSLLMSEAHVSGGCVPYDMNDDDKEIVKKIDEHIDEAYKLAHQLRTTNHHKCQHRYKAKAVKKK